MEKNMTKTQYNVLYSKPNLIKIKRNEKNYIAQRNITNYAQINKDVSLSSQIQKYIYILFKCALKFCSRRTFVGWMTFMTVTLTQQSAWALIPDDDDSELILKAKAKRKSRIKNELEAEKKFSKAEKYRYNNDT